MLHEREWNTEYCSEEMEETTVSYEIWNYTR